MSSKRHSKARLHRRAPGQRGVVPTLADAARAAEAAGLSAVDVFRLLMDDGPDGPPLMIACLPAPNERTRAFLVLSGLDQIIPLQEPYAGSVLLPCPFCTIDMYMGPLQQQELNRNHDVPVCCLICATVVSGGLGSKIDTITLSDKKAGE